MSTSIVYHPACNLGFPGAQFLHPFDGRKYARVFATLRRRFGEDFRHIAIDRSLTRDELEGIHSAAYLDSLERSRTVAAIAEIPPLALVPAFLLERFVLRPLRWGGRGTLLACQDALASGGLSVNLGGGYHHAKPDSGEGFCFYNDIAFALHELRRSGALEAQGRVLYIDLDAHMGNGVAHAFQGDGRVFLFDMYNGEIYPRDPEARARIDCDLPLPHGESSESYLRLLMRRLPGFIDALNAQAEVKLVIYNAGTDVYAADPLGGLSVSAAAILERDAFVLEELQERTLPTAMLLSGGYHKDSYRLVANSLIEQLAKERGEAARLPEWV